MANNDFFEEPKVEETTTQPETIKLGEKEYTQDDLSRLVGLGEQAVELESRWDTKIDRLMPEYSKTREELKRIREAEETRSKVEVETKAQQGEELSEAEQIRIAKEQAKKLGIMTREDFETEYQNRRFTEKFMDKTEATIAKFASEGLPKVSPDELIAYMSEPTNPKDPEKAYKLMFEKEIQESAFKKLQSIKPQGFFTQDGSTAGAKQPQPVTVTKDNFGSMLETVLSRGGGQ